MTAQPVSLPRIERFLKLSGMGPTSFGVAVANDGKLLYELRKGREMQPATSAKIAAFMERYALEQSERASALRALVK